MNRRRLLAGLGTVTAGLAGCTGRRADRGADGRDATATRRTTGDRRDGSTTTPATTTEAESAASPTTAGAETRTETATRTRTKTETVPDGGTTTHPVGTVLRLPSGDRIGVESVAVRQAVVYNSGFGSALAAERGRQFLSARVVRPAPASYTDPGWERLQLVAGDRRYEEGIGELFGNDGTPRPVGARRERALFVVPAGLDVDAVEGDATAAAIRWPVASGPDRRFALAAEHLRALRRRPAFSVVEFSVDDRARPVDGGVAVDVAVTVENDGDRGTFVGLLELPTPGRARDYLPSETIELGVEGGDRRIWSETVQWRDPPAETGAVTLTWSGDTRQEEVSFEDVDEG